MRAIQKIKETNPLFQHLDVETFKVISNVSVSILLLLQPMKNRTVTLILLLTIRPRIIDILFSQKNVSAYTNTYNPFLIISYQADIDIQPVLIAY